MESPSLPPARALLLRPFLSQCRPMSCSHCWTLDCSVPSKLSKQSESLLCRIPNDVVCGPSPLRCITRYGRMLRLLAGNPAALSRAAPTTTVALILDKRPRCDRWFLRVGHKARITEDVGARGCGGDRQSNIYSALPTKGSIGSVVVRGNSISAPIGIGCDQRRGPDRLIWSSCQNSPISKAVCPVLWPFDQPLGLSTRDSDIQGWLECQGHLGYLISRFGWAMPRQPFFSSECALESGWRGMAQWSGPPLRLTSNPPRIEWKCHCQRGISLKRPQNSSPSASPGWLNLAKVFRRKLVAAMSNGIEGRCPWAQDLVPPAHHTPLASKLLPMRPDNNLPWPALCQPIRSRDEFCRCPWLPT